MYKTVFYTLYFYTRDAQGQGECRGNFPTEESAMAYADEKLSAYDPERRRELYRIVPFRSNSLTKGA
jgi:hypothetical protein